MKKRKILILFIIICILMAFVGCSEEADDSVSSIEFEEEGETSVYSEKFEEESSFSIQFIDVGQGDAALVQCDGHYMLIDGGDIKAGDKVYNVLKDNGADDLDILVVSHLHQDHYGGLIRALDYTKSIGWTLCNEDYSDNKNFYKLEHQLSINDSRITIPKVGDTYELGDALVEIVDVSAEEENDSLVVLVTYGKTKFLFTGDIRYKAQKKIVSKYSREEGKTYKVDLIKMPHHGDETDVFQTDILSTFLSTFEPKYAVISVGANNKYGHPNKETLNKLKQARIKVYRTDMDGDIFVTSNGKKVWIKTEKN